jgi:hypothetical protein
MPSWEHEGIVELFRNDPQLAAELLAGPLGVSMPAFAEARIEDSSMTDLQPAETHADLVVTLRDENGAPVLGIIVEVQRQEDNDKLFSWPAYAALLRRSLRAPACVLVVTQSEKIANWAARSIALGPGGSFQPLVLRPSSVPIIDSPEEAQSAPELAVLSAMVHGAGPVSTAVELAVVASSAARALDRDRFLLYFSLIRSALSEAAREAFQMHPNILPFLSEEAKQSYDRGRTEGRVTSKAAAVVAFLDARGLTLSDEQRARIASCTDVAILDRWIRRAATIATADELFDD